MKGSYQIINVISNVLLYDCININFTLFYTHNTFFLTFLLKIAVLLKILNKFKPHLKSEIHIDIINALVVITFGMPTLMY